MQKTNRPTEYRKELKGRILDVAMNMFRQHGIRAVKMDDIATSLTISKRTLYEIFPNKEDLLLEGIRLRKAEGERYMQEFMEQGPHTTMDYLMELYRKRMEELSSTPSVFLTDISRYPRVLEYLRNNHVSRQEKALKFFQQGIAEGYFRDDVDYKLIVRLGESILRNALLQDLYEEYDLRYFFRNIIFLFLRGFCTTKGLEIVDEILKNQPETSSTYDQSSVIRP